MGMKAVYSTNKLLDLYLDKTLKIGHFSKAKEIKEDPNMPSYITYLRKIGPTKIIKKKLKLDINKLREMKVNKQFCSDCIYNPKTCGQDVNECRKEAQLYFKYCSGYDN